ncbi:ADP-ribosylation factor GTPase-activating, putative [Theileria equi strain WA]|uniref:ADP-ribosylation factor GTPase-activating, putative n=1 Tax=Theileria equi strain WA TaxID=1537102 RepID=L1LGF4_THEEQ|nr:ADP-ribosylation factor GTPase-activating, putative [Theileria equi strain WA]EKX74325.1 ADP-ribosylation factor GTPase-activating, putative [Theileria equi strain WA]|eukprot:XP_004833777.1 ADP-ribosylation factor GTPase-activating, putative [Theileria equi strain WA]
MDLISSFRVDNRGFVSDESRDVFFKNQFKTQENLFCFDCNSRNPTWVSLTYSVYLCLNCSGKHRQLGTHISFVRSTDMDKFTPEQLFRLSVGGNDKALSYFKQNGIYKQPINYAGKGVAVYSKMLDKAVATNKNAGFNNIDLLSLDSIDNTHDLLDLKDSTTDGLSHVSHSKSIVSNASDGLDEIMDEISAESKKSTSDREKFGMNKNMFNFSSETFSRKSTFPTKQTAVCKSGFSTKLSNVDFDALERSLNEPFPEQTNTSGREPVFAEPLKKTEIFGAGKETFNVNTNIPDLKHLEGKSGISSDAFFGRVGNNAHSYSNFNPNKTSLSSDEYFGRPTVPVHNKQSWNTLEDQAIQNINELKDGIMNALSKGNVMVEKAKQWLNNRY